MRMLVKYTAFIDLNQAGEEVERSYYLSFINKEDVIDIPFESLEELQTKAGKYTLAAFMKSDEFKEKVEEFDDMEEFFRDVETLVLYDESIPVEEMELKKE